MRLDLPHEPETPRRREPEVAATPPSDIHVAEVKESPLDRRLPKLRQAADQRTAHPVELPRKERRREARRSGRTREPERRPRRTREGVAQEIRGVRLRPEERRLLQEAGRFRVLNVKDIARTIYGGDERAMRTDLDYLRERGLVSVDSVAPRNDGHWLTQKRIELVSLTRDGEQIAYEGGGFAPGQKLYHGLVKPREAEHDSQVYLAYLKEAERIEKAGGANFRVELDFELKSKVQKAIHSAQKDDPTRGMGAIKREVADRLELPYVRDKIEIPDARIHYDQGAQTAFSDIEVVTAAYRPGHMHAKAQAGFRMYASASDRTRLGKIESEQHMLDWVMDL